MTKKNTHQSAQTWKRFISALSLIGFLLLPFTSVFGQPICVTPSTASFTAFNPCSGGAIPVPGSSTNQGVGYVIAGDKVLIVNAGTINFNCNDGTTVTVVGHNSSITANPTSTTVCPGEDAMFSVTAPGATMYQWQSNCSGTFVNIAGETNATLSLTGVTPADGCDYRVLVTAADGCEDIGSATLTVDGPMITTQPADKFRCVGADVDLTVTATGATMYQWQSNCSGTFVDITGETNATLSLTGVTAADACDYQVLVTNGNCTTPNTSDAATLTVSDLMITTQPTELAGCAGDDVEFEVVASGTGLTYEWQSNCFGNWFTVFQQTNATLPITGISTDDACIYRVLVRSTDGCFLISDEVDLTVGGPTIDAQPMAQDACIGDDAAFSVTASGGTAPLTYQWQSDCAASGTFADIAGETNAALSLTGVATAAECDYQVVVTDASGCSLNSDAVSLTLNSPPKITTQPTDQTADCVGDDASFTVEPDDGSLTFQWQSDCATSGTFVDIAGATSGTYTLSNAQTTDACDYQVIATDGNGCEVTSGTAALSFADGTAPNAVCQDIMLPINTTVGNASITAAQIDNGSTDNCGIASISLDITDFTCNNIGDNTVTLTVTDDAGNSATCTATVTVECFDPSIDCPPTQTSCTGDPYNLNPSEPGGSYGGTAAPFVMNDILNPTGMPRGAYTLTYTVGSITSEVCEFIVVGPPKSANAGSLNN